ncbi:hypothetical protein D9M71_761720 [compost metagenome]
MDIVFTGPLHTDGFAGEFLGQDGGFDDEVRFGLAPETAAQQGYVERDLVQRQSQAFADPLAAHLWRLTRAPGFANAILVTRDGDHRFHRRLRQVRQVVGRFQRVVGAAHGFVDVAGIAYHLAGFE